MTLTRRQIQKLGYSTRSKGGPATVVAPKIRKKRLEKASDQAEEKENLSKMLVSPEEKESENLQDESDLKATCALQTATIKKLQERLADAEKKLEMTHLSLIETTTGYEEQKKVHADFQIRLAEAESKVIEGEAFREKLHNTVLELKRKRSSIL